jgi:penicillin-binding protein 2
MPISPKGHLQGPPDPQLDGFEPLLQRPVSRRFWLFKGGIVLAFSGLAVRLWQMQIAEGRRYAALAEQNRVDSQPVKAPRGVIYDRNGIVLAGNKANWSVVVVPANLPREEAARRALFAELDRLLLPTWVLLVQPSRVPVNAEAAVYERLAGVLQQAVERVQAAVAAAMEREQTPVLADEVPRASVPAWARALAGLPGAQLLSQHEYLVQESVTDPRQAIVVQRGIPRDLALQVEGRSLLLPGVSIRPEPGRAYPSGPLVAHVVGYVGRVDEETRERERLPNGQPLYEMDDSVGHTGMEALLEPTLRGRKGFHIVEVDINRRMVRELDRRPPDPGASVALTIDLGLQKVTTDALNEELARAGVPAGAAVALDPATGEVLALVSLPSYNIQEFSDGISSRAYAALVNDDHRPLFNRCLGGLYAPGACAMPFVALAALRQGVIDGETVHVCKGGVHIPAEYNEISRKLFRCWQPGGHGPLTVAGALAQSCDVFFYNLSVPPAVDARNRPFRYYEAAVGGTPIEFKGLGIERLNEGAAAVGLGRKTGIELPGEEAGLLPTPEGKRKRGGGEWSVGDTINTGVGQGDFQVTPLQMAVAVAALANGGTLYRPRLLKSILRDGNRRIEEQEPVVVGRLEAPREVIETVRQGMRQTIVSGTGRRLDVPGIVVAGKTGTAETETADAPGATGQKPHAWFTAFAPYDRPRIALVVILEKAGYGAVHALPVAERMLRAFFKVGTATGA